MLKPRSLVLRTSLELCRAEPELEAAAEPRDLRPALRPRIICQRCVRPEQHEDSSVAPLNMLTPNTYPSTYSRSRPQRDYCLSHSTQKLPQGAHSHGSYTMT